MARKRWLGKTVFWLIVLGAAGGGAWWYYKGRAEPPPQFRTVAIEKGDVIQTVTTTGQLAAVVSVDVSSEVSGRLLEVLVDFNSIVKKGDVLARIDPATFEASLRQSQDELLNAEANLNLVRTNAARSEKLFAQSLISQSELDQIQAELAQAEVTVRIRQSSLENSKTNLSRCAIYAPIDGIVISRDVEMGQTVAASLNAPTLFVIANDLTKMQINAPVSEADIGQIKEGLDVTFTVDAYAGRTFTGKVIQVRNAPQTTEGVVSYATIISVENPDLRLKPGMTANVSIIVAQREAVLRVSNAALRVRLPDNIQPTMAAMPQRPGGPRPEGASAPGEAPGETPSVGGQPGQSAPAGTAPGTGGQGGEGRSRRGDASGAGFGGGPGGPGGTGSSGAGEGRSRREGRTAPSVVYRLVGSEDAPQLEAVRVRTGITDGSYTEIIFGLEEGDKVVTGLVVSGSSSAAASRTNANNPFSGGGGAGGPPGGFRRF